MDQGIVYHSFDDIYLRLSRYASVSLPDRVIIFGSDVYSSNIGVYKDGSWYSIGQLKDTRSSYGAIEQAGTVMIVGGDGTRVNWYST